MACPIPQGGHNETSAEDSSFNSRAYVMINSVKSFAKVDVVIIAYNVNLFL